MRRSTATHVASAALRGALGELGRPPFCRGMPDAIEELASDATGTEQLPRLGWNVCGYIAHMTDNTRIWAERLVAVARGADPHVVPYDPISSARPGTTTRLPCKAQRGRFAASRVANWLAAVDESDPAEVVMLHSERGAMELSDVVASNAHDAFHHRWDLARNSGCG